MKKILEKVIYLRAKTQSLLSVADTKGFPKADGLAEIKAKLEKEESALTQTYVDVQTIRDETASDAQIFLNALTEQILPATEKRIAALGEELRSFE